MKSYNENGEVKPLETRYKSIQEIKANGFLSHINATSEISINPVDFLKTDIEVQSSIGQVVPQGKSYPIFYNAVAHLNDAGTKIIVTTPHALAQTGGFNGNLSPQIFITVKERY